VQHVASRRRELEARLWEIDTEVRFSFQGVGLRRGDDHSDRGLREWL
jgi:hypothetical protein